MDSTTPKKKRGGPGRTLFKKGNNANPLGGGAHSKIKREQKKLTRLAISQMAEEIIHGDVKTLQAILKDPSQPALKMMMASIVIRTIQKGDVVSFENILVQILGKQTEKLQITGDPMNPIAVQAVQVRIGLPSNGRNAPEDPVLEYKKDDDGESV